MLMLMLMIGKPKGHRRTPSQKSIKRARAETIGRRCRCLSTVRQIQSTYVQYSFRLSISLLKWMVGTGTRATTASPSRIVKKGRAPRKTPHLSLLLPLQLLRKCSVSHGSGAQKVTEEEALKMAILPGVYGAELAHAKRSARSSTSLNVSQLAKQRFLVSGFTWNLRSAGRMMGLSG